MTQPAVLPFRKRGRPSKADELRIELDSLTVEERRFARESAPLLRRIAVVCMAMGVHAYGSYRDLARLHERHSRRWETGPEDRAA